MRDAVDPACDTFQAELTVPGTSAVAPRSGKARPVIEIALLAVGRCAASVAARRYRPQCAQNFFPLAKLPELFPDGYYIRVSGSVVLFELGLRSHVPAHLAAL